jgi:hypothetical protein
MMRLLNRTGIVSLISTSLALILLSPSVAFAATNPNLGTARSLTILSGTYSNTVSGTTQLDLQSRPLSTGIHMLPMVPIIRPVSTKELP